MLLDFTEQVKRKKAGSAYVFMSFSRCPNQHIMPLLSYFKSIKYYSVCMRIFLAGHTQQKVKEIP